MSRPLSNSISASNPHSELLQAISPFVSVLGYQVIHLEVQSHRQKVLRLFIDHLKPLPHQGIGIEDCARVSHALDEKIDQLPEIEALFSGGYDLEVSSPGLDRPLRTEADFERFTGHRVCIHTFRAMTGEEIGNQEFQEKYPKQKNFIGQLVRFQEGKVVLSVPFKRKKGPSVRKQTNSEEVVEIQIPLPLISKANLEPEFHFEGSNERE